jgi:Carboxypeptidase regulatory-like domain
MNLILRTVVLSVLLLNAGMAWSSTISGTVRDSEGAVVPKAQITVHRDPIRGGKETADVIVTSDKNGQFTLNVTPGFYDLFVSASPFHRNAPKCV